MAQGAHAIDARGVAGGDVGGRGLEFIEKKPRVSRKRRITLRYRLLFFTR